MGKKSKKSITNESKEKQHQRDVRQTNELIAYEDAVQTTVYAMNAPDCCSNAEKLDNMLSMLGADVCDDEVYHDEAEHFSLEM